MILCLALSVGVQAAPEADPPAAPFELRSDGGVFRITQWAPPPLAVLDADARTCRLGLSWTGSETEVTDEDCPDPVRREAIRTLADWEVEAPPGAAAFALPNVWFVYPTQVGVDVAVFVEQRTDVRLTLPAGVDAAPFAILAWTFLRFPEDQLDGPGATCRVAVDADTRGRVQHVDVMECPDAFREAASAAIRRWRFEPPLVHGQPVPTALTLSATFDPTTRHAAPAWAPSDARRALWASRQFDELTRQERVWFIQASLAPADREDLGPGTVRVHLPSAPELGPRGRPAFFAEDDGAPVRSLPDTPPVFVVQRTGRDPIEVYDAPLPPPPSDLDGIAACTLLLQVDGRRYVQAWIEGCDPRVRDVSLEVGHAWLLQHLGDARSRERFRLTFRFDGAAAPTVWLDAREIDAASDGLPTWVHTEAPPRAVHRVPPRLPTALVEAGLPEGECRMSAEITRRGRPKDIQVRSCPEGYDDVARSAVGRWRFEPAIEDGVAVARRIDVTIRFSP